MAGMETGLMTGNVLMPVQPPAHVRSIGPSPLQVLKPRHVTVGRAVALSVRRGCPEVG